MHKPHRTIVVIVLAASILANARDSAPFRSTKLLELQRKGKGFCFVVQLDDLAYLAETDDPPTSNLIVGDTVELKITGDYIRLKSNKKWPAVEPDGTIKTKIKVRQRMTQDAKLPTCAFPVSVH